MMTSFKKTTIKWTMAALALTLVVGCSSPAKPLNPTSNNQSQQGSSSTPNQTGTSSTSNSNNSSNPSPTTPPTQVPDSIKTQLLDMTHLAQQGKVINCDFPAKTSNIADIEKAWGKAEQTNYVAAAKGTYANYSSHKVVFGFNKGGQIFEVRSFASQLERISLSNVKEVLGTPAYDTKYNGQEIIGYPAGSEFKIEMVFPQPTTSNPDPVMDHYSVLFPQGTANMMADDPGRKW